MADRPCSHITGPSRKHASHPIAIFDIFSVFDLRKLSKIKLTKHSPAYSRPSQHVHICIYSQILVFPSSASLSFVKGTTWIKDHCHTSSNEFFVVLIFSGSLLNKNTFSNFFEPRASFTFDKICRCLLSLQVNYRLDNWCLPEPDQNE